MKRQQIVNREENWDIDDKVKILGKSDGKCCHCGKPIFVDYSLTIDHFIPLSCGGTNRMINLIGLCKDCNKDKGDSVFDPELYLKFINSKHLQEIKGLHESYIKSFDYISRDNLLANDTYEYDLPMVHSGRTKVYTQRRAGSFRLKRAHYCDLDKILNFYIKYLKKYDSLDSKEDAKANITFWYTFGCIYYVEKNGEVSAFVAITIEDSKYDEDDFKRSLRVLPFFYYMNFNNAVMFYESTVGLVNKIVEEQGLEAIPMQLCTLDRDELVEKTPMKRIPYYQLYTESRFHIRNVLVNREDDDDSECEDVDQEIVNKSNEFFDKFTNIERKLKKYVSASCMEPPV